jgi:hypothetical protein
VTGEPEQQRGLLREVGDVGGVAAQMRLLRVEDAQQEPWSALSARSGAA